VAASEGVVDWVALCAESAVASLERANGATAGLIQLREIVKTYYLGGHEVNALRGVTLRIDPGEFIAITGASGSGKSTMMHIIGLLDHPTGGQYYLQGRDVATLGDNEQAGVRNRSIGFVFQAFNLLARTSALKNVELPLRYAGVRARDRTELAREALDMVGLSSRMLHQPSELSGGQQQRVAVARALVTRPAIILADEPTGNLDTRASADIMELLDRLNRDAGKTVVLVTHEPEIAMYARRAVQMRDGRVTSDVATSRSTGVSA
jgi:putative ABC transport system ATP-binding protein